MYYYIFDTKKFKKKTNVDQIISYLGGLGIAGEYSYISSAYTAEELVELGFQKQYTTIVAVGSDNLINAVADKMIGREEAMGVIPLETSSSINSLLGVNSWKEGADSLRFRRIKEFYLGRTGSGKHFLTYITLDIRQPIEVTMEFKDYIIQSFMKEAIISNYHPNIEKKDPEFLDIFVQSCDPTKNSIATRIKSLFSNVSQTRDEKETTKIRARSLRIFSKKPLSLLLDGKIVSKTPQLIETSDNTLRLIVAKKGF